MLKIDVSVCDVVDEVVAVVVLNEDDDDDATVVVRAAVVVGSVDRGYPTPRSSSKSEMGKSCR